MENLRFIGCAILEGPGGEFFSLDRLVGVTGLDRKAVRRVMERLTRERLIIKVSQKPGYHKQDSIQIEFHGGRPPLAITYHVANRKKLIEKVAPKLKDGTAHDRMWRIIRAKGIFTISDLIILAEAKRENARWFAKMLRRAGIIAPSKAAGHGVTWRLIKDVGPKRPYVTDQKRRAQSA